MPLSQYGVLVARPVERRRESRERQPALPDPPLGLGQRVPRRGQRALPGVSLRAAVRGRRRPSAPDHRRRRRPGARLARPVPPAAAWTSCAATSSRGPRCARWRPTSPAPTTTSATCSTFTSSARSAAPTRCVYLFGERWGPETVRDKIFGFKPGNGVHDIHMNQGNSARFAGDDGVWQDGGMLIHFPSENRWVGIFLAFQSQAWHTDDTTGHTIVGPEPGPRRPRSPRCTSSPRWSTRTAARPSARP